MYNETAAQEKDDLTAINGQHGEKLDMVEDT
jgi:hypothetical protein